MQSDAENTNQESGFDKDSILGTFIVAGVLCLVCSLVVSTAAVALKPLQEKNAENKKKRNVLAAAGFWDSKEHTNEDIPKLFEPIETVLVNLPSGEDDADAGTLNTELNADTYDQKKAAKDPERNLQIDASDDVADIKRRARVAEAYLVKSESGKIETIVLPVYGKGLWSTLYGFLALDGDGKTVKGITFYEHGETPGLGGEVDNPKWKALWPGTEAINSEGQVVLDVAKPGNATQDNQVDGLSGATITSNGVENTVKYWLGDQAFGPFLERIRNNKLASAN